MKTKLLLSILVIIIFLLAIQPKLYAGTIFEFLLKDDIHIPIEGVTLGETAPINYSKDMTEKVLGILQLIGSIISIIALIIIGVRYMLSSLEEKAKLKGIMGYYLIGAILVFGTSNILSIAYRLLRGLE